MEFAQDVNLSTFQDPRFSQFAPGKGVLITFAADRFNEDLGAVETVVIGKDKKAIKNWGKDNKLPQRREELLCGSNIVATLISTKRDITIGSGIYFYKEELQDGKKVKTPVTVSPEISEFMDRLEAGDYFENAGSEYFKHANVFTEFIPTKKGGKVFSLDVKESKFTRAGSEKKGNHATTYHLAQEWSAKMDPKIQIISRPALMENARTLMKSAIYHTGDRLLRPDGFYFSPSYWGGQTWIALANVIPEFHKNNLLNSYSIKYHIEIPNGFFKKAPSELTGDQNKELAAQQEKSAYEDFIQDMNKWLAGIENQGRTFFSSYELNKSLGKDFPGIKITPLKVDLQDKALLDLFEKSNQANISAQGVPPSLAAIETPGKLGSGSEIRNAFLMYAAIKTPQPRKTLLKPLQMVQRINGWDPELKFGFLDMEITTLDKNPNGISQISMNGAGG